MTLGNPASKAMTGSSTVFLNRVGDTARMMMKSLSKEFELLGDPTQKEILAYEFGPPLFS